MSCECSQISNIEKKHSLRHIVSFVGILGVFGEFNILCWKHFISLYFCPLWSHAYLLVTLQLPGKHIAVLVVARTAEIR